MYAKEFRIGNLVNYLFEDNLDDRKEWWESSEIDANDIVLLENGVDESYQPIPLTEEWLLKFGFIKDKVDSTYYKNDFEIMLPNFFNYRTLSLNKIKSVHQLQNLYFALTGKELELK